MMITDLQNKIARVIGGTGEQGMAICKQLSLSGAKVITETADSASADKLKKVFENEGLDIHVYPVDITDFDSCEALVNTIESNIGPIDIIINSMDLSETVLFKDMEKQQWNEILSINLDALFNVCKQVAAGMGERGFGRIVNISSMISRMGRANSTHYATAKAGIHGFTMALAQELARKGVTVNTISPGEIANDDISSLPEDEQKKILAQIPTARLGKPDEVAYLVDFLCSEQAAFINGADIAINGGQYMH
jgi:acetoacetyl-CoA reductase